MGGLEGFIAALDFSLSTRRKRHVIGGFLISLSALFGGLAITVMTIKGNTNE